MANICCNECLPGNLRITQPRVLTFMTESSFVILRKWYLSATIQSPIVRTTLPMIWNWHFIQWKHRRIKLYSQKMQSWINREEILQILCSNPCRLLLGKSIQWCGAWLFFGHFGPFKWCSDGPLSGRRIRLFLMKMSSLWECGQAQSQHHRKCDQLSLSETQRLVWPSLVLWWAGRRQVTQLSLSPSLQASHPPHRHPLYRWTAPRSLSHTQTY